jgi:tetratricopeptide (TPR) repeat protein
MATKTFHDPLLKSNFASPFLTTRRNEILDLLANSVILPAYILCIDNIITALTKTFPLPALFNLIIWLLALLPLVGIIGANIIWRLGFKGRKRAFAIGFTLILALLFNNTERTIYLFVITFLIIALEFLIKRIIARRKLKIISVNLPILFLTTAILAVTILLFYWINTFPKLSLHISTIKILILAFLLGSTPFPLILGIQDAWASFTEDSHRKQASVVKFLLHLFTRVVLYVILTLMLFLSDDLTNASILALSLMALASGISDLLSRQRANFRNIFRSFQKDYIYRLISPTTSPANLIIALIQKAKGLVQKNLIWIFFLSALIFGGFLLPGFLYWKNPDVDIWKLFNVAILGSFLLILLSIGVMIMQIRARHIVIPFTTVHIGDDAELDIAANIMTHAFVEQLREVTILLNLRQVENLSLRSERGLAVFVTSGLDQDFIDQVRSLGNIETSELKMPFGNIFGLFIQQLAETQVRGTVKRQDDNSIAVWVEFSKRGGRSFGVDLIILPDEVTHEINNDRIIEMANILAVKLVAKLGFHSHLATSWESMHLFLEGLNAAYHRNWWQAIENYQKAVHIEGVTRNSFGYGYYHLGAVLMSQGEISKGMKYLQHAELSGPPLAETQYMLALGLFLQNRDRLHKDRTIFTDIEWRCKTALNMRQDFPEAHHLLGTAYYQRGRLREREWTSKSMVDNEAKLSSKSDPISKHYEDDYSKASHHLRKSIKAYDHAIRYLPNDAQTQSTIFDEQSRLVQDRIAATHRLADALRCLKLYAEADSYYREVLVAYPRNNRTLVDLAKTYTLAKNWGRADEFLRGEVFNHPELYWNKSACFYMGWSQLGGLTEIGNPVKRALDTVIRGYELIANWKQTNPKTAREKILWNAVCWLDYAIHQYPGYLYVWRQMNWLESFKKVVRRFGGASSNAQNIEGIYQLNLGNNENYITFLKLWMAWRILGNAYQNDEDLSELARSVADDLLTHNNQAVFPNPHFGEYYQAMKGIRAEYVSLLEKGDNEHSIKSIRRRKESLLLGEKSYNAWKKSTGAFTTLLNKIDDSVTFGDRWSADIFADLSLLTIKILVEGKAYEYAKQVAELSLELLSKMKERCDNACTDLEMLPLGGKVATYQLSMLYAWQAYAMLMIIDDVATLARINDRKTNPDEIQKLIEHSKILVGHNPLTILSQALLYKHLGFLRQAADELNQLATLVAPFDPHKYIIRDFEKNDSSMQVEEITQPDSASRLYKKERIHGRRQLDTIVNLTNIHYTLASVHALLEEYYLVSMHINTAIGNSPHQDVTAELFLNLAITLNRQEKYDEALTAAEKAIERHVHLSRFHYKSAKTFEPFVLECVLLTNSERYSTALEKAYQVIESVDYKNSMERHLNALNELKIEYSELQQVVDHLSWFESKLKKAIKLYESNIKSVAKRGERFLYSEITDLCLRHDKLSKVINRKQGRNHHRDGLPVQIIFSSQLIALLARDIFEYRVYFSDMLNNISYNWVELNTNLQRAMEYSTSATNRMYELLKNIIDLPENRFDVSRGITKKVKSEFDSIVQATAYYEERLANYLDTKAWAYYKLGKPRDLTMAQNILEDEAIKYGANNATIYYHLARLCITKIEQIWQSIPTKYRVNKNIPSKEAHDITNLLRLSTLYWRQAMGLNQSGNLRARLSRIHERLISYRQEWEKIYRVSTNSAETLDISREKQ